MAHRSHQPLHSAHRTPQSDPRSRLASPDRRPHSPANRTSIPPAGIARLRSPFVLGIAAAVVAATAAAAVVDSSAAGAARGQKYAVGSALSLSSATAITTVPAKVTFVAAADGGGGNTRAKRVVVPSAAKAGNTALLFLSTSVTSTWSAPSGVTGWKLLGTYAPSKLRTAVWAKVLAAGDVGRTVQFTANGYTHAAASVFVYSGLDPKSPVRAFTKAADVSSRTHVSPKVQAVAGDWVLTYWADRASTVQAYTAPGAVRARVASPDSGTSLTVQSLVADSNAAVSTGSYGGLSAVTSGSTSHASKWSIVLRPAAVVTSARPSPKTTSPSPSPTTTSPSPSPTTTAPSPSPTTTAPSSSATPTPTPTSRPTCVSDPRGIPAAGTGGLVGATVSGTAVRSSLESSTGTLRIYRDYYNANQVDYAVNRTAADLAAGRLPWISFKLPYKWADMAAGKGDAWAIDLVTKLSKLNGPVWLTFHHEPENDTATDGTMQDWKAMQQHLAPIVHSLSKNIAFAVVLMAWNTLYGPAEDRLADIYPGSQYVDILGFDLYNEYGAKAGHGQLDFNKYFTAMQAFTSTHGNVPLAIGEVGYTSAAAQNYPTFLQDYYKSLLAHGGIGMAYFDSSYNSIADWTLDDALRLNAFKEVLGKSLRMC